MITQDRPKSPPSRVANTFSLAETRAMLTDLFKPSARLYWADFLVSLSVGLPAILLFAHGAFPTWIKVALWVTAVIAMFRAASFIHGFAHLRKGELRSFRVAWDLLIGIPFLMPSFFYLNHLGHHNRHRFGTDQDGEYLPLASGSWRTLAQFLLQVPVLPLWVLVRFLASPFTFITPRVRQWTLEHWSSFVINFHAKFEVPKNAPRKWWTATELVCSAIAWGLVSAIPLGIQPLLRIDQIYLLAVSILSLNYLRTLCAHRYTNDGHEMTFREQFDDSINIEGHPILTEIIFPVGLRYHALHHLFPSIPYHNLGIAHRRLMRELPSDSPYRATVFPSVGAALKNLATEFRASRRSRVSNA